MCHSYLSKISSFKFRIVFLPGLALVTANAALLWTDGRYFLQATEQLSSDWKLMRVGEDVHVEEWIAMVGR